MIATASLLLGALLNASSLATTASTQPDGWRRDVAVAVTEPLHAVSEALRLDRPRTWIDQALGRDSSLPTPQPSPSPEPTSSPDPTPSPEPSPSLDPTPSPEPSPSLDPTPQPSPTPTSTVAPSPGTSFVATVDDPATLLVAGDSLTESFGPALVNLSLDTGVVQPAHHLRYSSGLTRPDFYDWPAQLDHLLSTRSTDIVIFMIGANDGQAIQVGGTWIGYGEPGWIEEYHARVEQAAVVLSSNARTVYWVGQPIARSTTYRAKMAAMNAVYAEVAGQHANVTYVSSWELFSTADGGYADYLPDADGRPTLVRRTDGIHLTPLGGQWLADHVLERIRADWTLRTPAT